MSKRNKESVAFLATFALVGLLALVFITLSSSREEVSIVVDKAESLIVAPEGDTWIYSDNGKYSVQAAGYSGGYPPWTQPEAFHLVARKEEERIIEQVIYEEDVQTVGSLPSVLGITNDGAEVWGLSHIHGTCPCYLGLWTISTEDGSVTKYQELYDLHIDQGRSDYDFKNKLVIGAQNKEWPPVAVYPTVGENLVMIDLQTGESQIMAEIESGMFRFISFSPDLSQFAYTVVDDMGELETFVAPMVAPDLVIAISPEDIDWHETPGY
jgi:hypothetical protein